LLLERQRAGTRPIRELNSLVDRRLANAVQQCLAFEPSGRPASAAHAGSLLRRPPGPVARLLRPVTRHPWLCLTVLLALGVVASPVPGMAYRWANPPLTDLQLAQQAEEAGDLEAALVHLEHHLEVNKTDARAWLARGKDCLLLADTEPHYLDSAFTNLMHADRLEPQGRTKACIAYTLQLQKRSDSARYWYAEAVSHGFENADLHNNVGTIQLDANELDAAEQSLTRSAALDPSLQAAHHNLGVLRMQQALRARQTGGRQQEKERLRQGLAETRRAIELGPPSGELYRQAATLCACLAPCDSAQVDNAVAYLDLALQHGMDPAILKQHPFATRLQKHPQFSTLCRRQPVAHPDGRARRVMPMLPE
jgi:Tfp pilus assembly protein PilF